eukprot:1194731-Prorocentrum_minimum.AAC.1
MRSRTGPTLRARNVTRYMFVTYAHVTSTQIVCAFLQSVFKASQTGSSKSAVPGFAPSGNRLRTCATHSASEAVSETFTAEASALAQAQTATEEAHAAATACRTLNAACSALATANEAKREKLESVRARIKAMQDRKEQLAGAAAAARAEHVALARAERCLAANGAVTKQVREVAAALADPVPSPIDPVPSPIDPVPVPSPIDPVPVPSPIDPVPSPIDPVPSPIDPVPSPSRCATNQPSRNRPSSAADEKGLANSPQSIESQVREVAAALAAAKEDFELLSGLHGWRARSLSKGSDSHSGPQGARLELALHRCYVLQLDLAANTGADGASGDAAERAAADGDAPSPRESLPPAGARAEPGGRPRGERPGRRQVDAGDAHAAAGAAAGADAPAGSHRRPGVGAGEPPRGDPRPVRHKSNTPEGRRRGGYVDVPGRGGGVQAGVRRQAAPGDVPPRAPADGRQGAPRRLRRGNNNNKRASFHHPVALNPPPVALNLTLGE